MKIGITGATGFLGGHVAEVAISRGHTVVLFDRSGKLNDPTNRLIDAGKAELFLGDVRDNVAMTELAAHCDSLLHLAACLGTQETILNPRPAAETNILGGLNFLEACAQYKIPGVYIGVGNYWMNNSYSITKTTIERFVDMFNKERGTKVNIVRLVNAYGPRQSVAPPFGPAKVRKITPAFVCRALTGQNIEVYGDGEQISDMVHVRDGAFALVRALEYAKADIVFDRAVECGPRNSLTVNEIARKVISISEKLGFAPVDLVHLPMRPGEIPGAIVRADTSTLDLIGVNPDDLINIEDGLLETVNWFRENWLPGYLKIDSNQNRYMYNPEKITSYIESLEKDNISLSGCFVSHDPETIAKGLVHEDTETCKNHQDF